jgi:ethanolaminephosphotransferase
MGYITKEGLKELDNYKYKPGKYTILDNIMNPYWEWCVKLVPTSVAPNVLTLAGWLLVIASYANILRYDYTFKKDVPASAFFFAAFCIFAYSTLDAIDGKQARRTKSGSPLGQLFDHGCDSFSLTFFVLGICQATLIEKDEVFLIFIVSQVAFWTSNWSEHHTGILKTNLGQFGVTEAEYTVVIVHILTGIFGQHFWKFTLAQILPQSFSDIINIHPLINHYINEDIGTLIIHGFAVAILLVIVVGFFKTLYEAK